MADIQGTSGSDTLVGTGGVDTIEGLGGADTLVGKGNADMLFGGGGSDELFGDNGADDLFGGGGDDILSGGGGDDDIRGGSGLDTAVLSGVRSDYDLTLISGGIRVFHARGAQNEGVDLVFANVEFLAFADVTYDIAGGAITTDAEDDSASTNEDRASKIIDVLSNDTDLNLLTAANIKAIAGHAVSVGETVALTSGARVTLLADGRLDYDAAGAFENLASGAAADDSFTYLLEGTGGVQNLATVSMTVNGRQDPTSITYSAPPGDGALTVNGGGFVQVAHEPAISPSGSWTVEAWFRTDDADGQFNRILRKAVGGLQTYSLLVKDGEAHARFDRQGGGANEVQSVFVADGAWHHMAGVYDEAAGALILYVDGMEAGRRTVSGPPVQGTDDLFIGAAATNIPTQTFDGDIAEVRVWSRALTQVQIDTRKDKSLNPAVQNGLELYLPLSGDANDIAGDGRNGTVVNTVIFSEATGLAVFENTPGAIGPVVIADPDAEDVTVTLTALNGALDQIGAGVVVTGEGSGLVEVTGSVEAVNAALTVLRYTPDPFFFGEDTLTITADDADPVSIDIFVTGVPSAPVAVNDDFTTSENNANKTLRVLKNDQEFDGDEIFLATVNGEPVSAGDVIPVGSGSRLTINANGSISFDANGAYEHLTDGQSSLLLFSYEIEDSDGLRDQAVAMVTIEGRNDAPEVTPLLVVSPNQGDLIEMLTAAGDFYTASDADFSDRPTYVTGSLFASPASGTTQDDLELLDIDPTTGAISYDRADFSDLDYLERRRFDVTFQVESGPDTINVETRLVIEGRLPAILLDDLRDDRDLRGFEIAGAGFLSKTGSATAGGHDVNGDGLDDMIVGSPGGVGAHVVFGKSDGVALSTDDIANGVGGFAIYGHPPSGTPSFTGESVAIIDDINGDGLAELVVGAPFANASYNYTGEYWGGAYVIFGKADGAAVNLPELDGAVPGVPGGFIIRGAFSFSKAGGVVSSVGDVNGDGLSEILVGAEDDSPGAVYLIFGKADQDTVDVTAVASGGNDGILISDPSGVVSIGAAVTGLGDVDGDGRDDILVGAQYSSALAQDGGAAYVIFGGDIGAEVDLRDIATGYGGFVIQGSTAGARFGSSVGSAGDMNGDGFADMVIGVSTDFGDSPAAYVVFGASDTRFPSSFDTAQIGGSVAGFTIVSDGSIFHRTPSVSGAGDVNGDGLDDILLGAYRQNTYLGVTYVIFGGVASDEIDLADIAAGRGGFAIESTDDTGKAGFAVSAAGDVNGDGYADLMAGAPDVDGDEQNSGSAWVIFGGDFTGDSTVTEGFAKDNAVATHEDRASKVFNVLGNDSGSGLTITHIAGQAVTAGDTVRLSSGAEATLTFNGGIDYDVNGAFDDLSPDEQGTDVFAYTVEKGNGAQDVANVSVTIDGRDDAPLLSAGPAGGVLALADDRYVEVPHDAAIAADGSFTIEAWIRTTETDGGANRIAFKFVPPGGQSYSLLTTNGEARVLFNGPNGGEDVQNGFVADGEWHHVAGVFDQSALTLTLYVDGAFSGSLNTSGAPLLSTSPLYIGSGGPDIGAQEFNGEISEVRYWDTARSAAQIAVNRAVAIDPTQESDLQLLLTFDGDARDHSGNGLDGVVRKASDNTPDPDAFPAAGASPVDEGARVREEGEVALGAFSAFDIDDDDLTVTLTAENGVLDVDQFLASVAGDETDQVVISGAAADVQAALDGLIYRPDENFIGRDTVTISADGSDAALIPVLVSNGDEDPPEGTDDVLEIFQDQVKSFNVIANDIDPDPATELTITMLAGAPVTAGDGERQELASGATVELRSDGRVRYDPRGDFETLRLGQTETDSFTYTISDGNGGADVVNVAMTVRGRPVLDLFGLGPKTIDVFDELTLFSDLEGLEDPAYVAGSLAISVSADSDVPERDGLIRKGFKGLITLDRPGFADLQDGDAGIYDISFDIASGGDVRTVETTLTINGVHALIDRDVIADPDDLRGFAISGEADDAAGASVAGAGDVNGDGYADLIIGASQTGANDKGAAHIVFGKADGAPVLLAETSDPANSGGFSFTGRSPGDLAGASVSGGGDVNGDGLDDLIIASPSQDLGGTDRGAVYVVFGKTGGDAVAAIDIRDGVGGFVINGATDFGFAGSSVSAAGDVNGDGFADILLGAPFDDPGAANSGAAFVVFGKADGAKVQLSKLTNGQGGGFAIEGAEAGAQAGYSVSAAGDVNGDGLADLIIGANRADAGGFDRGAAYVVFGRAEDAPVSLTDIAAGIGGFQILGGSSLMQAGFSVSGAGDVNKDGLADLMVGAPFDGETGSAFLVYGKTDGASVDLETLSGAAAGFNMADVLPDGLVGADVAGAGDVNGDGRGDFLISSPAEDLAYLVYGREDTFVSLEEIRAGNGGFAISGPVEAIDGAGDVNGDGFDDLLVGGDGETHVIFGGELTNAPILIGDETGETLSGDGGANRIVAGDGDDLLRGRGDADILFGGAGDDEIVGGNGADQLTGGAGLDRFVFDKLDGVVDRLNDFTQGEDLLIIDGGVFGLNAGALAPSRFDAGTAPQAPQNKAAFLFDTDSRLLIFDANGAANGGRTTIAEFIETPTLDVDDFLIL